MYTHLFVWAEESSFGNNILPFRVTPIFNDLTLGLAYIYDTSQTLSEAEHYTYTICTNALTKFCISFLFKPLTLNF